MSAHSVSIFAPAFVLFTAYGAVNSIAGPAFLRQSHPWAQKTLQSLSIDDKIAQLIMLRVCPNSSDVEIRAHEEIIKKLHVGGIFLSGRGTISQQIKTVNRLQAASRLPLLVGQDQENGPAMRLYDAMSWPLAMTFGAVPHENLIYRSAVVMGEQARALGVHITASPVADANTNPTNPIINVRAYGDNVNRVARTARIVMTGLLASKVLACAKHFPGHGDTDQDSHLTLPTIHHSRDHMHATELVPFQTLINDGIPLVMVGHLAVPAFDPSGKPATLSRAITTTLLKNHMNFGGITISDSLSMKALPNISSAEINLRAVIAGTDLLLGAEDITESLRRIKEAVRNQTLSEQDLTDCVHKILVAKEWLGLTKKRLVTSNEAERAQGSQTDKLLRHDLYRAAITIVHDKRGSIPLTAPTFVPAVPPYLVIAHGNASAFYERLQQFVPADYQTSSLIAPHDLTSARNRDRNYDALIYVYVPETRTVGGIDLKIHMASNIPPSVGDDLALLKLSGKKVIVVICASPYALEKFPADAPTILAYEGNAVAQQAAAEALCGAYPAQGVLPISFSQNA